MGFSNQRGQGNILFVCLIVGRIVRKRTLGCLACHWVVHKGSNVVEVPSMNIASCPVDRLCWIIARHFKDAASDHHFHFLFVAIGK